MVPDRAVSEALRTVRLAGRLQQLGGDPQLIVDVAHNPQAAAQLAAWLKENPCGGRTVAVFGALADKDIEAICEALTDCFDAWHLVGLDVARGLDVQALQERVATHIAPTRLRTSSNVANALAAARQEAGGGGRVLVFGSFHTVGAALGSLQPTAG
jgi:dihydrofolate synthase/folylpolyglutamate synthase